MSDEEQRARYRRALDAIVRQVPGNGADEYGLTDAVLAVRDRETEQLRAGLRTWAAAFAADGPDLITKGHVARRITALLEGESA